MKASQACVRLIKHFEGFHSVPYLCPANVWTIGYGTTLGITSETPPITIEQGEELLKRDLVKFERSVMRLITVPLKQNEFDALVSFVYNLGGGALQRSTLRAKTNRGDKEGAAVEFMKWTKAGGRELMGLVRRRKAEMDLFNGKST